MSPGLARLLTRLYPRRWRERYGEEFESLLKDGPGDFRVGMNVVWSAVRENISPTGGLNMDRRSCTFGDMTKMPSAFFPLGMSAAALIIVLGYAARFGVSPPPTDEGATAHIWQLLMAAQVPLVVWFAIRGLPRAPRQTLQVLALQAGGVLANLAAVFFLGLG